MPGPLLHLSATVLCAHGGQATPAAPNQRVLVSGQPVVTNASPHVIIGCAMPPPPGGNGPCVTATSVTAALRVLVSGQPVLLMDSQAICAPTGTPLLITGAQTRVIGI